MRKPKWILHKTLERRPTFRPIEDEDVPYVGAAYRQGTLNGVIPDNLPPDQFKAALVQYVLDVYDAAWTMIAPTKYGVRPVGLALGFWLHKNAPIIVLDTLLWFPWATKRNRVESAVNFAKHAEFPMIAFARGKDENFMKIIARHGVTNRVGTARNIFADEAASVWETKHG